MIGQNDVLRNSMESAGKEFESMETTGYEYYTQNKLKENHFFRKNFPCPSYNISTETKKRTNFPLIQTTKEESERHPKSFLTSHLDSNESRVSLIEKQVHTDIDSMIRQNVMLKNSLENAQKEFRKTKLKQSRENYEICNNREIQMSRYAFEVTNRQEGTTNNSIIPGQDGNGGDNELEEFLRSVRAVGLSRAIGVMTNSYHQDLQQASHFLQNDSDFMNVIDETHSYEY